jgi:hypothetical protein
VEWVELPIAHDIRHTNAGRYCIYTGNPFTLESGSPLPDIQRLKQSMHWWLKHFDRHTKARQVGGYRLLILDGYESHLNKEFKHYCLKHKILTLCILPHSSHVL